MTLQAARRADGSKPVVGSSRKMSSGSPMSPSATSSRRRCPPESCSPERLRLFGEADELDRVVDVARRRVVARVQLEALAHRQAGLRRRFLEHGAHPVPPFGAGVRRIDAEHLHLAVGARAKAFEDLHGRRLPGAVRAEEGEDLAAADLEVDPRDGFRGAVALLQAPNGDHGVVHGRTLAQWAR